MKRITNALPLASVIMPCNNAARFIAEAVESILLQDFKDFELLIIDYGANDKATNLILSFDDTRIRYFEFDTKQGNCGARNFGIAHALGKYIAFADAEDLSLPYRLSTQYSMLENHPDTFCVGSSYEIMDVAGRNKGLVNKPLDHEKIKVLLFADKNIRQPAMMIRNTLCRDFGFRFDESFSYAGDYDFVVRVAQKFKVQNISKPLVRSRIYPEQVFTEKREMEEEMANRVRRRQLETLGVDFTEEGFHLHLKLIHHRYLEDHELDQVEAWLNRLLTANQQKMIYDNDFFYSICENLAATAIRHNRLGGWSIEKKMIACINEILVPGSKLLEFGTGKGTEALLHNYQVTSIEHDTQFCISLSKEHQCMLAPIEGEWYSPEEVKSVLSRINFDLILVDGPPGTLRQGILNHLELFKGIKSVFVFDDMDRELDRKTMITFCKELCLTYKIIQGDRKQFAVCRQYPDDPSNVDRIPFK
ncbi:glycosyltransferase family 2 protein [Cyclobacterium plantarum]|uniref:glycosyltransferase family 2 protein n=1 Tax=Cyclobacterium plantarum TaxID=2716263 RepID=UPI003F720C8E